jgi:predicted nucleic-acid-binding protein
MTLSTKIQYIAAIIAAYALPVYLLLRAWKKNDKLEAYAGAADHLYHKRKLYVQTQNAGRMLIEFMMLYTHSMRIDDTELAELLREIIEDSTDFVKNGDMETLRGELSVLHIEILAITRETIDD